MRTWRDTPFQSKVTLAMFLISCCVIFIAFAALLAFQLFTLHRNFERDVGTLARIMATNCSAAVAFDDQRAASAILDSLQAKQFFNRAWIETPGNHLFAVIESTRPRDPRNKVKPLRQSAPVHAGTERIATLWVEGDLGAAESELIAFSIRLGTALLLVCTAVGWFLARQAQRIVLRPVLDLASAAERIARDRDLSLRVTRGGDDEIGLLARRFNEMLSQIEVQDWELKRARSELVSKVVALEFEIAERRRIEVGLADVTQREERRLANDLHDGLGQLLTGIAFKAHLLKTLLLEHDPARAPMAENLVDLANESIKQARDIAHGVAPVDLGGAGVSPALAQLAAQAERLMGVICRVQAPADDTSLPLRTSVELYRISQEAVHNATRHGRATEIDILLEQKNAVWRLEIRDNGCGLPPPERRGRGLGLKLMQHRAGSVGGTVVLIPNEPRGLIVRCAIPVAGEQRTNTSSLAAGGH